MLFTAGIHTIEMSPSETGWTLICDYEGAVYRCENANFSPLPSHPSRSRQVKALILDYECECDVNDSRMILTWHVDIMNAVITVELKKQTTNPDICLLQRQIDDIRTRLDLPVVHRVLYYFPAYPQ